MSVWGTDIFSDDLAASIRKEYNALLAIGKDGEEAEQLIMRGFADYVNQNPEEEPVFWFALALAESRKGRLSEFVKNQAMYYLDHGGDLERWNTPGNQKKYLKRVQVIEKLRETLTGPQPEKRKSGKLRYIIAHGQWAACLHIGLSTQMRCKDIQSMGNMRCFGLSISSDGRFPNFFRTSVMTSR